MAFQIVAASKQLKTEKDVRAALAKAEPGWVVTNVEDRGDVGWLARLEDKVADIPPFLKKDDAEAPPGDSSAPEGSPEEEASESPEEEADEQSKGDDKEKGGEKGKGKDLVSDLESLVQQVTQVLEELKGKAGEVADDAKAKDDTIKGIHDQVKEHGVPGEDSLGLPPDAGLDAPMPSDVGPVPGKPGAGAAPPRKPGVPTGRSPRGRMPAPLPTAFTKRHQEVVTHPGVDNDGNVINIVAAAAELERDPDWSEYEVAGMTTNRDGTFSALLRLKSE